MSRLSDRLNELNSDNLPLREIAERAARRGKKISFSSVSTYLNGKHPDPPSPRALDALAAAFGVPVSELEEAAAYTGREPFNPDPTSDQLTQPQRNAVNEIIRLLAAGNQGADHANVTSLSAHPRPGTTPETTPQKTPPADLDIATDDELRQRAAYKAPKLGRKAKRDQDEAAETPDGQPVPESRNDQGDF